MNATRQRTAISDKVCASLMRQWQAAGLTRGAGWGRQCDNYERGKAIVSRAANRNAALYRAGIDLLADYLEI